MYKSNLLFVTLPQHGESVLKVQEQEDVLIIDWSSPCRDVIIEVMDSVGKNVARTERAGMLRYERSPDTDVVHVVVRASDGNVLAKKTC